jgi:hypothetical protein
MSDACKRFVLASAFAFAAAIVTHAQWLNYKTPGIPRTADGKPKLDAPAPRSVDGHPDLSGVWMHELTSVAEMRRLYGATIEEAIKVDVPGMEIGTQHKYGLNVLLDFKPEDSPIRAEATEAMRRRQAAALPGACTGGSIPGFPVAGLLSEPIKIVQAPRVTIVMYEAGGAHRQVFTDGRTLPRAFDLPAYYGYSVGRWDHDTFVVETTGFNDKTRLDVMGHPHSDQLRVTERFHRRDFGHLDVEMTFDDPKMYTRPFTIRVPHDVIADADIFEMFPENEKDCAHLRR